LFRNLSNFFVTPLRIRDAGPRTIALAPLVAPTLPVALHLIFPAAGLWTLRDLFALKIARPGSIRSVTGVVRIARRHVWAELVYSAPALAGHVTGIGASGGFRRLV
jgi:hypothetical protein